MVNKDYLPRKFNELYKGSVRDNELKDEVFSQDLLRILMEVLTKIFGPTGAAFIVYHIGRRFAEIMIERSMELNIEISSLIKECFQRLDIGLVEIENKKCKAIIKDNYYSIPTTGEGGFISCYLIRGFFHRYLQITFNEDKEVEERRCRAHGNQFCEFCVREGE